MKGDNVLCSKEWFDVGRDVVVCDDSDEFVEWIKVWKGSLGVILNRKKRVVFIEINRSSEWPCCCTSFEMP